MSVLDYLTNCKVLSTVTQEEDEAAWLRNRSRGIGGSDVGTICGVNKYSSPRLLYLHKTGQFLDGENEFSDAAKERMHFGHVLEPIVADEFMRRTGKQVVVSPATLQHKDHPWALANVDRFIVDENGVPYGVLECKTADARMNKDWEEGDIPMSYIYQLNWYLWITDLKYGSFAALVGGNRFHFIEVWRNDELLKDIVAQADKFWNYNVMGLVEPAISGSPADTDFIKERYDEVKKNSEVTLASEEMDALADVIFTGKQQLKELERIVEDATNKIKEAMKENEIGYTSDHVIKWSPRRSTRIDTDKLKVEYPEVYEACKKTSTYRVFTIK